MERTEEVCEYLWNSHAAAIASDTFAVEAFPIDPSPEARPFGFLHNVLDRAVRDGPGGAMVAGDLAQDCAADGVYESFLVSAPMNAPGGIGSPANAVAIKLASRLRDGVQQLLEELGGHHGLVVVGAGRSGAAAR